MLTGFVIGALSAAVLVQPTDTIVQAEGATRLAVESFQGQVVIRSWDRDAVQIRADHPDTYSVSVKRSGSTISVEPDVERGMGIGQAVDFEIMVPRRFNLNVEGIALDVDIQGTEGAVEVGTVHGPIKVVGGRGSVSVGSVNGEIHLEGVRGDLEVTGVAGGVTIRDCVGDIQAESVGGSVVMERVTSANVEVGTVGGSLRYQGTIEDGGRYNFGSHGGEIWLYLPGNINAEFEVLSLVGDIEISYPGAPTGPTAGERFPGMNQKELRFELGTGSARIEVETFGGKVHILRQGG